MIAALEPLHEMLEAVNIRFLDSLSMILIMFQGPTTARETSFVQVFGRDLHEAREATRRWRTHGDTSELDKAWDIYFTVRISRAASGHSLIFC